MSDLEQNLRDMLARRADAPPATSGDWQDLTVRMAKRNRHSRRMLAGALALVLIVGPLAGFAVARAVEDSDPGGQITAGGPSDGSASGSEISTAGRMLGDVAFTYTGAGQLDPLFRRTGGDGVAIRAYISRFGSSGCQGDGWCPPVDCFADASIVGELSTDAAVGTAMGDHYAGTTTDLKVTGGGVFGANGEGAPARWTIAQVTGQVAKVRVSYEGGGSDEMAPVDGTVLLAARSDVEKLGGKVEALDGSGSVLADADAPGVSPGVFAVAGDQVVVSGDASSSSAESRSVSPTTVVPGTDISALPPSTLAIDPNTSVVGPRAECQTPPPTMPAPGAQPADAAAAKAEVEHAFATAYAGGLGDDQSKADVVEDSDSLTGVMDEIRTGSFQQQVKDATAKVTDVVFTSPTEASVRYDIEVANSSTFSDRIGKARFIDGRWKVARVTVCADIALAGATCPAK